MAAYRIRGADRCDRPSAAELSCPRLACRPGSCALPCPGKSGCQPCRTTHAGMDLSHRHEIATVIDGLAEPGRKLEDSLRPQACGTSTKLPAASHFPKFMSGMAGTKLSNFGNAVLGTLDIETINPTCIEWWRAAEGFGVPRYSERNGPWPRLYCPSLFYPRFLRRQQPNPRVKHRLKLRP